jgi:hypothetical protein
MLRGGGAVVRTRRWSVWIGLAVVALLLATALIAVSGAAPEAAGAALMLGLVATVVLYVLVYVLERRRHW